MDKIGKKILIVLIICIVILLVIIYGIIKVNKKSTINGVGDISKDIDKKLSRLDNYNIYNSIEKLMRNYYLYGKVKNSTALISILDKGYLEENGITKENVKEKVNITGEKYDKFHVEAIYSKLDVDSSRYLVNINNSDYYIFNRDYLKNTFSIIPLAKLEFENYIDGKKEVEILNGEILPNKYNTFKMSTIKTEEVILKYFEKYIDDALFNIESAYNSLDKEYREKRFGSIENYEKYVKKNYSKISSMSYKMMKSVEDFATEEEFREYINNYQVKGLDKWAVQNEGTDTYYVCIDSYGDNIIFKEETVFNYSVILDDYTNILPEQFSKYNQFTIEQKVNYNILRLKNAIKNDDYRFLYLQLDETFRKNNFKSELEFENFVKSKSSKNSNVVLKKLEDINGVYIQHLEINGQPKKIIMKLGNEGDFTYSFNK